MVMQNFRWRDNSIGRFSERVHELAIEKSARAFDANFGLSPLRDDARHEY
jgi:hypothetical protein